MRILKGRFEKNNNTHLSCVRPYAATEFVDLLLDKLYRTFSAGVEGNLRTCAVALYTWNHCTTNGIVFLRVFVFEVILRVLSPR